MILKEFFAWLARQAEAGTVVLYSMGSFRIKVSKMDIIAARFLLRMDSLLPGGGHISLKAAVEMIREAWFYLKRKQKNRILPHPITRESIAIYRFLVSEEVETLEEQLLVLEAIWWWLIFWVGTYRASRSIPPVKKCIPPYLPPERSIHLN